MHTFNKLSYSFATVLLFAVTSCNDFIEIDPPRNELVKETVFTSDEPANAAVLDIYYEMHNGGFASGNFRSISLVASLSSDELINGIDWDLNYQPVNDNAILADNTLVLALWTDLYKCVYKANAVIEGLEHSSGMTPALKDQLEGESKFVRAFCYFYLVNFWGDVPLALTTDYKTNEIIGRTPSGQVYAQIISDLQLAQALLTSGYEYSGNERIRPNKDAATALLARVYLFIGDWPNAEQEASSVIENTSGYSLVPLTDVFLKNNPEAIWQLLPNVFGNTHDVETFLFYGHKLAPELMGAFETDDQRKTAWTENGIFGAFDYPVKYKDYQNSSSEYSVVLRLAEQYLIRAEARARQDNIAGAQSDINSIRMRAGLAGTTASDQAGLLDAVMQERRMELFTEWGHRWLDLNRSGKADPVLSQVKDGWQATDALYPIPETQITNDPAMRSAQNPGY